MTTTISQQRNFTPNLPLSQIKGFILDMDGVLYRGNQARRGAIEFVDYLNTQGIPYICLTNNSSRTSEMYEKKLAKLGFAIDRTRVIGSAYATAQWLIEHAEPSARLLFIGEAGLREELTKAGFRLVSTPPAEFVVVGIDFNVSYERLKQAAIAIQQKATFIGTNPDRSFPDGDWLTPGTGASLAFLSTATGVKPIIMGKPDLTMMQYGLDKVGLPRQQVAMVGDRLDSDILGGQNAGLTTILLRGGVTSDAEYAASAIQADYIFDDLGELQNCYTLASEIKAQANPC
jgi:4-nitrophenyl phosphatase